MAGCTGEGDASYHPFHMLGRAIAAVAVAARVGQDRADVESGVIVLGGVRIKRIDDCMAAAATGTGAACGSTGAAFQRPGCGGVAGVAVVLVDIDNEARPGMTASGAARGRRESGMGRGNVVFIVCASGWMAVDAIAATFGRVAIGSVD